MRINSKRPPSHDAPSCVAVLQPGRMLGTHGGFLPQLHRRPVRVWADRRQPRPQRLPCHVRRRQNGPCHLRRPLCMWVAVYFLFKPSYCSVSLFFADVSDVRCICVAAVCDRTASCLLVTLYTVHTVREQAENIDC